MNLARFDLLSIRLALVAIRSGNLTVAATESHLALAAASRRLKQLEQALGSPLVERHARGLRPTPTGHVFVTHALTILQAVDRLGMELSDLRHGVQRHVRLAASTAAISQFLPPLLVRCNLSFPDVCVDLEEHLSQDVVRLLRQGLTDIGVFVDYPGAAGLRTRLFREDELVVLLPPGHALARKKSPISFVDLLDEDWVGLNNGAAVLAAQQQAAVNAGKPLRMRVQVRSFDVACQMVLGGMGLAILPRNASQATVKSLGLSMRALTDEWAHRRILLALADRGTPNGEGDQTVQALADLLCEQHDAGARQAEASQNAKA